MTTYPGFEIDLDSVFVIESLRRGDPTTGENVHANAISPYGKRANTRVEPTVRRAASPGELFAHLAEIADAVHREELAPILQFDCHGDEDGWEIGGQVVSWGELVPALCLINQASRMNLFVLAASCSGAHLFKALTNAYDRNQHPHFYGRAPLHACWGHAGKVSGRELARSLEEFYRCLLGAGDSAGAWSALSGGAMVTASDVFRSVDDTMRREDLGAPTVQRFAEMFGHRPDVARARYRALRDVARERYFWLDLFPENAERFARFASAIPEP